MLTAWNIQSLTLLREVSTTSRYSIWQDPSVTTTSGATLEGCGPLDIFMIPSAYAQ